jgi:hypothetical protein
LAWLGYARIAIELRSRKTNPAWCGAVRCDARYFDDGEAVGEARDHIVMRGHDLDPATDPDEGKRLGR